MAILEGAAAEEWLRKNPGAAYRDLTTNKMVVTPGGANVGTAVSSVPLVGGLLYGALQPALGLLERGTQTVSGLGGGEYRPTFLRPEDVSGTTNALVSQAQGMVNRGILPSQAAQMANLGQFSKEALGTLAYGVAPAKGAGLFSKLGAGALGGTLAGIGGSRPGQEVQAGLLGAGLGAGATGLGMLGGKTIQGLKGIKAPVKNIKAPTSGTGANLSATEKSLLNQIESQSKLAKGSANMYEIGNLKPKPDYPGIDTVPDIQRTISTAQNALTKRGIKIPQTPEEFDLYKAAQSEVAKDLAAEYKSSTNPLLSGNDLINQVISDSPQITKFPSSKDTGAFKSVLELVRNANLKTVVDPNTNMLKKVSGGVSDSDLHVLAQKLADDVNFARTNPSATPENEKVAIQALATVKKILNERNPGLAPLNDEYHALVNTIKELQPELVTSYRTQMENISKAGEKSAGLADRLKIAAEARGESIANVLPVGGQQIRTLLKARPQLANTLYKKLKLGGAEAQATKQAGGGITGTPLLARLGGALERASTQPIVSNIGRYAPYAIAAQANPILQSLQGVQLPQETAQPTTSTQQPLAATPAMEGMGTQNVSQLRNQMALSLVQSDPKLSTKDALAYADMYLNAQGIDTTQTATTAGASTNQFNQKLGNALTAAQKALSIVEQKPEVAGKFATIGGGLGRAFGVSDADKSAYQSAVALSNSSILNALSGTAQSPEEKKTLEDLLISPYDEPAYAIDKLNAAIELLSTMAQ